MANRTNQIEKEITEKLKKIENKDIKLLAEIQRLYVESIGAIAFKPAEFNL